MSAPGMRTPADEPATPRETTPEGQLDAQAPHGSEPRAENPWGENSSDAGSPPQAHHRPWKRFAFGGPGTGVGTLAASVLALGLGFAVMTQVRQHEKSGLDNLSQPDLVALLLERADPSLANSDPLAAGWFFKVKLSDPAQLDALLEAADYDKFAAES